MNIGSSQLQTKEIIDFLKQEIAPTINRDTSSIDEGLNFLSLGISSIDTLKIINRIQKKLNIEVNPIAMFEYKTLFDFAEYLNNCLAESAV